MNYSLEGLFKKALVTGGAGFVGSNLAESLLIDGLQVVVLDDYSAGKPENHADLEKKYGDQLKVVNCDITDKASLAIHFKDVDIVYHQACSKMTICLLDPIRDLAVNAIGTFNLLELSRDNNVAKFVHVSTGSVYGKAIQFPTDENHQVNPASYYGVSKLAGEKYVRLFAEMHGLNTSILRYFHVYGPKQDAGEYGGVIGIFCENAINNREIKIFGDGTQIRSFTHVYDVVNINKLVAKSGLPGEAYNCASGLKVSINDIAAKIVKLSESKSSVNYYDWKVGDVKDFDVSNEKLKSLGFEFQYMDFDKGLEETFNWYARTNG